MKKKTKVENTESVEAVAPKAAEYVRKRTDIEVAKLKLAPWNPRAEITPESVADLAASIKSLGMIQPVVAMIDADGGATLIAGHRRLAAAKIAGLETVPCDILVGVDEPTAKRMTFIENLQRVDADPLLESELVGGLVKSGMTQAEIAAETGRGREWVARRMNLANLSTSWRKRVEDGEQITTDCLEHVAAYPEAVQEKLKGAKSYNGSSALRWGEIKHQFNYETCDLKTAKFERAGCRDCPNNTGCSPELFDWEGRVTAYGKCMDPKCYKSKTAEAIEKAKKEAKADGMEVLELKNHPDYTVQLQDKRDAEHNTLYVWTDYNGDRQMQWGQKPATGAHGGEMTEEQKEERRQKIAANKARRKLAEWCEGNLSGVIMAAYTVDAQIALAFQKVFDLGSAWRVFGSETNTGDALLAYLINPDIMDEAGENWPKLAAHEIAAKLGKPEVSAIYAERLLAIFPGAEKALTEEERRLIVSDERLAKLRAPFHVKWTEAETDAEAEDAMLTDVDAAGVECASPETSRVCARAGTSHATTARSVRVWITQRAQRGGRRRTANERGGLFRECAQGDRGGLRPPVRQGRPAGAADRGRCAHDIRTPHGADGGGPGMRRRWMSETDFIGRLRPVA